MTDQILVIPKLLEDHECDSFIKYYESHKIASGIEHSLNANTGEFQDAEFRAVSIPENLELYNLAHKKMESALNGWVSHLSTFNAFNIKVLKSSLKYPHKIRVLKYKEGSSIHPHTDFFDFCYASCTLNLNDSYEGGEFSFFNGVHNIKLGKGDALVFPNSYFWVHEVLKITKGVRYSINSFITSIPMKLAFQTISKLNSTKIEDKSFQIV